MEGIIEFINFVPTWIWIIGAVIIFMLIFGDRGLWDYEVKFPLKTGVGRGEIDFEAYKKKGTTISVKLELEERMAGKEIEIFLKNRSVYKIPAENNAGNRIFKADKIELHQPTEGDEVIVEIGGESVFSGPLIKD